MTKQLAAWTLGVSLLAASCAPFPVPHEWPVEMAPDRQAATQLRDSLVSSTPVSSLTRQEQVLLAFLSDNERINQAIGKRDHYGTRTWRIAEIFLVEPGRRVSVLCEEGHNQEAIYFRYRPENKVWYRVGDFEDPTAKEYPAVIVR